MKRLAISILLATPLALAAIDANAACMNKFVAKSDGPRQNLTLLTGKLTFQEAQALAASIKERKHPGVELVDDKGKTLARQFGEFAVVRPMPVGCDGRASGVVATVTFATPSKLAKRVFVKFTDNNIVEFEEQAN